MLRAASLLILSMLFPIGVSAAEPPKRLETVVVSGVQPGPGLWRVSRDGHEMWILGTLSPLPKRMEWESRDVEATIARSKVVVMGPSGEVKIAGGALRGLFLLPSLLGARNNPDDALLKDVVPEDLYARWSVLKTKYLGRNRGVEKRRPIVAALKLFEKALARSGLTLKNLADPVVLKAAKKHDVEIVRPKIELVIEEPKDAVREFKSTRLDDVECFRRTLDRVESDLEAMQDRANAWATGDIAALREARWTDQGRACADAFLQSGVFQRRGMGDLEQRFADVWLKDAEAALAKHDVSFAVLPMWQLINRDGYLAALAARGYRVEAPDDVVEASLRSD